MKVITVKPYQKLSLQYHEHRNETWTIVQGKARITKGHLVQDVDAKVKPYTTYIPKGTEHRIENTGDEVLIFVETQTGTYFGEDDIVRISDDYGRV